MEDDSDSLPKEPLFDEVESTSLAEKEIPLRYTNVNRANTSRNHITPENKDAQHPSQGQHKHETDPFRALLIREDDDEEENSDSDDDEEANESHTSSSEDESPNPPDPVPRKFRQNPPNKPKNILGITVVSLNMRG